MATLPEIFENRMKDSLGQDYEQFRQALEAPPVVSIRRHPLKKTPETGRLEPVPWHPEGRYLPQRPVFTLDPAFHAGAYYVQEASSMFVRWALEKAGALGPRLHVLDLCAAPGGKATLLADLLSGDSLLVANETIQSRLPSLRENLARWGYPNLMVSNHDPAAFEALPGFFDIVLVDAPCSGEGLFRKNPLAAREWSPQNLEACQARQRRILSAARRTLKPGGVLLYSTCTFNPGENEEMAEWLLRNDPMEGITLETDPAWGIAGKSHGCQFYPHLARGEGFYIACFRKMEGERRQSNGGGDWQGDWQLLRPADTEAFRYWLSSPEHFLFYKKANGGILAMPASLEPSLAQAGSALRRRSAGILIGEMKNRDFIPSHDLAMSHILRRDIPCLDLDQAKALRYLKREAIDPGGAAPGWTLARFGGNNLGWLKVLPGRVNNYLPNEWRIRMELGTAASQQEWP